jgi:hypothetical protein
VVPIQFDLTNYTLKKELEKNWDILWSLKKTILYSALH